MAALRGEGSGGPPQRASGRRGEGKSGRPVPDRLLSTRHPQPFHRQKPRTKRPAPVLVPAPPPPSAPRRSAPPLRCPVPPRPVLSCPAPAARLRSRDASHPTHTHSFPHPPPGLDPTQPRAPPEAGAASRGGCRRSPIGGYWEAAAPPLVGIGRPPRKGAPGGRGRVVACGRAVRSRPL